MQTLGYVFFTRMLTCFSMETFFLTCTIDWTHFTVLVNLNDLFNKISKFIYKLHRERRTIFQQDIKNLYKKSWQNKFELKLSMQLDTAMPTHNKFFTLFACKDKYVSPDEDQRLWLEPSLQIYHTKTARTITTYQTCYQMPWRRTVECTMLTRWTLRYINMRVSVIVNDQAVDVTETLPWFEFFL